MTKLALSTAAFAAAAGFFWGSTEALCNYYRRPAGTWWGNPVWESAFRRSVFYAVVVLSAVALAFLILRLVRPVAKKKAPGEAAAWRGAAVVSAVVVSNVGWFLASLPPKGKLDFGIAIVNLRHPGPFYEYWIAFVVLGVALAAALGRFAVRRRWWRRVGSIARPVGAVGFVALASAHVVLPALRPVPPGPNVVLIILDAWRADAFRDTLMPNLAAYAENNATVYRRVWSCAPWTGPSMASIFTGRYPDTYKLWIQPRSELNPTVAQILWEAGYDTAAFVGNPVLEHYSPVTAGFDHYRFWDWSPILYYLHFYDTNWYCPALRKGLKLRGYTGPQTSYLLTREAVSFLERSRRRPYFLWLHYMDPHGPYAPPPEYCLPRDRGFIKGFDLGNKENMFVNHRLYENECSFVDDLLPSVLGKIAADPNTVVIITSDHGEEFWEHDTFGHGESVYEAVTRVPLIISVPGKPPATTYRPTSHIDLAPTILDVAGVEPPRKMTGESLLAKEDDGAPELIFVGSEFTARPNYNPPRRDAVILWPLKLILPHCRMTEPGEYYDLSSDRMEQRPLAEDKMARELRNKLRAWKRRVKEGPEEVSALEAPDAADLRALGYIQ